MTLRVRGAAAASLPHLMQSLVSSCKVKGIDPQMIKQRFDWLFPELLKAATQEPDIDLIYVMIVSVHEVRFEDSQRYQQRSNGAVIR
jgi:hypothetical protein